MRKTYIFSNPYDGSLVRNKTLKERENTKQDQIHDNEELQVLSVSKENYKRSINMMAAISSSDLRVLVVPDAQCVSCYQTLNFRKPFAKTNLVSYMLGDNHLKIIKRVPLSNLENNRGYKL
jgi:hypothetical protein